MSLRDLPEYVERASDVVWRPPSKDPDVDVYGFVLPADPVALDRLLDRDLNDPSFGAVNYRSVLASVIVLVGDFHGMTSAEPPDSEHGYLDYHETGIWCLALDTYDYRLVWYVPYIFSDAGETVAGGREIYGYPKKMGTFQRDYPRRILEGGRTTVRSDALKVYGPGEKMQSSPMLSIDARALDGDPPVGGIGDFIDMFDGRLALTPGTAYGPPPEQSATIAHPGDPGPPRRSPPHRPWTRRILDAIQGIGAIAEQEALILAMVNDPTLVFLKQFRDIACRGKACYQAVTETQFGVAPRGFGRLPEENYRVTVHDWASQPIASDLGLVPDTALEPAGVFWAKMSLAIGLGVEVWRAPT